MKIFLSVIALMLLPMGMILAQPNNPGKKIFIYMEGNSEDYIYHADRLLTKFDEKKGMFNFWLPFDQVKPQEAGSDTEMLESVFADGNDMVFKLSLLLSEAKNVQDFKSPQRYALDGMLTIAGQKKEVPVHITLMSSGNSLFYQLSFNVLLETLPMVYRQVLTGQMVFVVKQSVWRDFFSDY